MRIMINDGEDVTIQKNHDKSKKPWGIVIMRRGDWIGIRQFGDDIEKSAKDRRSKGL